MTRNLFSVPLGMVISMLLSYVWIYVPEQPNNQSVPHYQEAVICYAIASFIYLLSEPFYVISQILLYSRLKVCSVQCSVCCVHVYWWWLSISVPVLSLTCCRQDVYVFSRLLSLEFLTAYAVCLLLLWFGFFHKPACWDFVLPR